MMGLRVVHSALSYVKERAFYLAMLSGLIIMILLVVTVGSG
ncbi:MAG TPA: hypothetical protein VFF30_18755 [Nitrososphaerales archaeon]|nr:hypothetical protein [Nitrososphaerales archaeon]